MQFVNFTKRDGKIYIPQNTKERNTAIKNYENKLTDFINQPSPSHIHFLWVWSHKEDPNGAFSKQSDMIQIFEGLGASVDNYSSNTNLWKNLSSIDNFVDVVNSDQRSDSMVYVGLHGFEDWSFWHKFPFESDHVNRLKNTNKKKFFNSCNNGHKIPYKEEVQWGFLSTSWKHASLSWFRIDLIEAYVRCDRAWPFTWKTPPTLNELLLETRMNYMNSLVSFQFMDQKNNPTRVMWPASRETFLTW